MKTIIIAWIPLVTAAMFFSSCNEDEEKKGSSKPADILVREQSWHVLDDPSAGFEISMPGKPKRQEKKEDTDNGPVTSTAYLFIKDNAAYSVVVTNMPLSVANGIDPEKEFDDTVKKLQKKVSGTILEQKSMEINGIKSRKFSMSGTGPSGKTLYRVKLLRVGQNTIQLMTANPMSEDQGADSLTFFNSFKLKQMP